MKRKRISEDQIVRILAEADRPGKTVSEVCRAHGVSETTFYRWRKQFKGLSIAGVPRCASSPRRTPGSRESWRT